MYDDYLPPYALAWLLHSVDYRQPGVEMALYLHPYEGYRKVLLHITMTVPNAYDPDEEQKQSIYVPVPPIVSVKHFHDWLKWRLETIVLHELNEMYWAGGQIVLDPHSDEYWKLGTRL